MAQSPIHLVPGGAEPTLSKTDIINLQTQHGDDLIHTVQGGKTYVFRSPTRAEWMRYQSTLRIVDKRNGNMTAPGEQLCCDCLVHPVKDDGEPDILAVRALFDRRPGLPLNIASKLQDLAGAGDEEPLAKL